MLLVCSSSVLKLVTFFLSFSSVDAIFALCICHGPQPHYFLKGNFYTCLMPWVLQLQSKGCLIISGL